MIKDLVLKVAAKAVVIDDQGRVLVVREARTYDEGTKIGKYGLPGGRLNLGESYNDGLHREVKEETGLKVEALYPIYVGEWHPVIKDVPHQIIAIFTVCKAKSTDVKLSTEHDDFKWLDPKNPGTVSLMEPDNKVLAAYSSRIT